MHNGSSTLNLSRPLYMYTYFSIQMWNFGPKRHSQRGLYFKSNARFPLLLKREREGGFEARDAFRIREFAVPNFHRRSRSTGRWDDRDFSNTLLSPSHGSPRSLITFPERRSMPSPLLSYYTQRRELSLVAALEAAQRAEYFSSRDAQL